MLFSSINAMHSSNGSSALMLITLLVITSLIRVSRTFFSSNSTLRTQSRSEMMPSTVSSLITSSAPVLCCAINFSASKTVASGAIIKISPPFLRIISRTVVMACFSFCKKIVQSIDSKLQSCKRKNLVSGHGLENRLLNVPKLTNGTDLLRGETFAFFIRQQIQVFIVGRSLGIFHQIQRTQDRIIAARHHAML